LQYIAGVGGTRLLKCAVAKGVRGRTAME
jgi:hypothetical protein